MWAWFSGLVRRFNNKGRKNINLEDVWSSAHNVTIISP